MNCINIHLQFFFQQCGTNYNRELFQEISVSTFPNLNLTSQITYINFFVVLWKENCKQGNIRHCLNFAPSALIVLWANLRLGKLNGLKFSLFKHNFCLGEFKTG